jgi:hypothetical protein
MSRPVFLDQGDYEEWRATHPMIGIYVPTLGRPGSSQRLADNVQATTHNPYRLVFVVEKYNKDDYEAAARTGATVLWNSYEPSYSNAIQTAYEQSPEDPYFIAANDDFEFTDGWDTEALKVMGDGIMVAGIDDGGPHNEFKTICLVDRRYIESMSGVVDQPNRVFHTYHHNYVDTEFHYTAYYRGAFAPAPKSVVRHRHPEWGFARDDSTYRKSREHLAKDGNTYQERRHLWLTQPS